MIVESASPLCSHQRRGDMPESMLRSMWTQQDAPMTQRPGKGTKIVETHLSIRNALDNERRIIRDLTIAAYAQYQAVLPPDFWTYYQHNLIATVDGEGNGE